VKRFNAHSYWLLTKAMDSHNISRGRDVLESVLSTIDVPAAIIGISTDFLCPLSEQKFMAKHIPHAAYHEIDSPFGHDGFLIEGELIGKCIPEL
jgi:homoserine O-acetyltransferase